MHRLGVIANHVSAKQNAARQLLVPSLAAQTFSTAAVRIEKTGPVTTIILSRPEAKNAVDGPTSRLLANAFREFEADNSAKVAVLWGANGTFCAGADLKAMGTERQNPISTEGDGPMGPSRMMLSKPVIAAISGFAVAGGIELACWCDLRVVEENAIMGVFCRRWGVPLIDGGTYRLPALIGLSRAMDLILTGRPVTAKEALEMGLANRVVPIGTARQEAEKLALAIASFPQKCLNVDRESAYRGMGLSQDEALKSEFENGVTTLTEALDGAQKFASGAGRHGKF